MCVHVSTLCCVLSVYLRVRKAVPNVHVWARAFAKARACVLVRLTSMCLHGQVNARMQEHAFKLT
jgi:hypothetical protein